MIDITEFLRRLTKKVVASDRVAIKVVFLSNGTEINIRSVDDGGRIYYAYGERTNGPSKSWTPHKLEGIKYSIARIEEQRINYSRLNHKSNLVSPINKAVIYLEKIEVPLL